MRTIKLLAMSALAAASIASLSVNANADDTPCFEINETFGTRSVMDALNEEVGLPGSSATKEKNQTMTIGEFDFKKLGKAQKNGSFVYAYDDGKSDATSICYRFKSQSLERDKAAKNIIPTSFCVTKV